MGFPLRNVSPLSRSPFPSCTRRTSAGSDRRRKVIALYWSVNFWTGLLEGPRDRLGLDPVPVRRIAMQELMKSGLQPRAESRAKMALRSILSISL